MQPAIPGFYYDEEKRKYFKILPTAASGGSSAFYTSDVVNKRIKSDNEQGKRGKDHANKISLAASDTPISPLHAASLSRSLGHAAKAYYCSVVRATHLTEMGGSVTSRGGRRNLEVCAFVGGLRPTTTLWRNARTDMHILTCMDIRKNAQGLERLWVGNVHGIYKEYNIARCLQEPSYSIDMTTPFAEFSGPITSITKTDSFGVITAETLNPDDFNAMLWTPSVTTAGSTLYRIHRFRTDMEARCSAASSESYKMTIGGSDRISVYQSGPAEHRSIGSCRLPSDVFTVECLEPHTFLAGLRDASVRILDTRIPARGRNQPVALWHASAITKMKIVKEGYLVLAGLEDSLALYDLRFAKAQEQPGLSSQRYQHHPAQYQKWANQQKSMSRPVIKYDGYVNEHVFDHGFDISNDKRTLAVADQSRAVKLYSLWTGNQLRSPVSDHKFQLVPRALKWNDTRVTKTGMPIVDSISVPQGLFITNGGRLEYWSWDSSSSIVW
ncbi:hypothetical protein V1525DRAFT_375517 [Lipomyces kononenkoae]|uniref:Uncharacterized protein n=1 Tax=Lipomyces kononenkoae TaxID=34357 RepID=A0ACC3T2P2_LIPKO